MVVKETDDGFVSLICPSCHQEIEASCDMLGQQCECPACGAKVVIPRESEKGTSRNPLSADTGPTEAQRAAMKSRTIRIELDNL